MPVMTDRTDSVRRVMISCCQSQRSGRSDQPDELEQFQATGFFDFLQLKFSYGYQGNMLEGQSPEMIIKKLPLDDYYHELVSEVSIYPNPDLQWERTSSLNAGIEFSILDHRLMVSDYLFLF